MQINRKNITASRHRKGIVLVALIILLCGISGYYIVKNQQQSALKENQHLQPSSSSKESISKDSNSSKGSPNNSAGSTSEQVPVNSSLSVSIVSASQANNTVSAEARVNGSGICVFLYKPSDGGKPVTRQIEVGSGTCSTSISANEFAYLGQWTLTVTYYSDGGKAEASQNVTIH